jgi:hypothetical protein
MLGVNLDMLTISLELVLTVDRGEVGSGSGGISQNEIFCKSRRNCKYGGGGSNQNIDANFVERG